MTRLLAPLAAALLPLGVSYGFRHGRKRRHAHGAKLASLPACEIHVEHEAGQRRAGKKEKVFSARAIAGSYQLKISNGASSSSISQGGDFTVAAAGSSSLGLVSLPHAAAATAPRSR